MIADDLTTGSPSRHRRRHRARWRAARIPPRAVRGPARATVVVAGVLAVLALLTGTAHAAPPPNPLPWQRTYVPNVVLTQTQFSAELFAACGQDIARGVADNGAVGKPKFAVIGDSVQVQTRAPAMADTEHYRWLYGTHCGEKFHTVISSGRLADAVATAPAVLVVGMGSNNFSENWQISPALFGPAVTSFNQMLDQSASVPCRVLINLPEKAPDYVDAATAQTWISLIRQMNQVYANAAATRPGVYVADWRLLTALFPALLQDDQHLTRAGTNLRINLAIATARQCFPPDTPIGVNALAGNGTATVWWDALPPEEKVTAYRVETSDGRTFTTPVPTLNVGGLVNGTGASFRVTALNAKGASSPSAWTTPVTPSPAGARFHALPPTRVLDTRDGTGGKSGRFGPGETFTLDVGSRLPAAAAGSALVLNVTATGQSAESFVTVWPGGQGRPLASNLNPRPGGGDTPAMVTTRVGPGGTVSLYNNSGDTHLLVDVVGWYDQPGAGSGALYVPLDPTRVLDSRDGTGGKLGAFSAAESLRLQLAALPPDASAAVVNVTSVNTTNSGFVTLSPAGQTRPLASNLNPTAGRVRANLTTVAVGTDRSIDVFNNTASTDLVIDLVGYYTAAGALTGGAEYFPITPERAFDSRDGTGGLTGPVTNAVDTTLAFAGRGSLPASPAAVSAVDANLTVVAPSASGHTTVWPSGPRPNASILNFSGGEVVPNRDYVTLASGAARIWSVPSQIHYVVDVSGWFGPPRLDAQTLARRTS